MTAGASRPGRGRTATGARRWRGLTNVGPVVVEAMRGNAVLRAFSGYMVFFLAFYLRTAHFSVSHNFALGALVAAAAAGGLAAMAIGSLIRARAPVFILFAMLTLAPIVTAVCAWFFSLEAAIAVAFTAALAAGLAKLSLDSTVQREIGEEIRSSAFAVSETLNQVANVAGSLVGVLVSILDNGQLGLAIAAGCLTAALITLVARRRRRILALRTSEEPAPPRARPRRPRAKSVLDQAVVRARCRRRRRGARRRSSSRPWRPVACRAGRCRHVVKQLDQVLDEHDHLVGLLAGLLGGRDGGRRLEHRTWSACAPRRPSATPNSTRCPCRSAVVPEGSADECTKTSPPSSRARKPYPLSESYHLTLPVGTRRPHVEEN